MLTAFARLSIIAVSLASFSLAQNAALPPTAGPIAGTMLLAPNPPITAAGRVHWLLVENLAPASLLENVAIGAEQTETNSPWEYGPHWTGFAKRVGMVTANYGVKTTMEAGLGSIWGEDPRYDRAEVGSPFTSRLGHVVKMAFFARNANGDIMPGYARFMAFSGSNFLENTWMPDSQSSPSDAAVRTGVAYLSRMAENAYKEFIARRH